MSKKPKVAIITRTKDRSIFLKRALESVQDQTFDDYVHVIVNDGGDPYAIDSLIVSLPGEQQEKVKIFNRSEPSSAPDTIFNESIDRVDSEYFAIHDDDDTWHPDFLEKTVGFLDKNQDYGAVVVRTNKVIETVAGDKINIKKTSRYMLGLQVVSLYRQCLDNQLTPIATVYRRDSYEKVGKFDDSLPVVGDWEFGVRLLKQYEVGFIDPGFALANYHHRKSKNDNSFTHHNHRKYVTLVANRYLRQELSDGKLGVGYIMSKLKYDQDQMHSVAKKIIPKWIHSRFRD